MWLTSSSIGRKFVMAVTGIALVLFVTFHVLMNAVAIVWPTAYNTICMLLGANWYALIASVGLAVLFIIHIIYALWLTVQNRAARGADRYAVNAHYPGVEWSSKNMLVLGIVVVAFLVVHLIQFWARMQLQEILGHEYMHDGVAYPPEFGTLFLQAAFSLAWTPIVYIIGFIALWFHMTHGFWSMFHTIGWDNNIWIKRLKTIGCWWTSIVIALFVAQAIVFTVKAHNQDYVKDPALQAQYAEFYSEEADELIADINAAMAKVQKENPMSNPQDVLVQYADKMQALVDGANGICADAMPNNVQMLANTLQQIAPFVEQSKAAQQAATPEAEEAVEVEEEVVTDSNN